MLRDSVFYERGPLKHYLSQLVVLDSWIRHFNL